MTLDESEERRKQLDKGNISTLKQIFQWPHDSKLQRHLYFPVYHWIWIPLKVEFNIKYKHGICAEGNTIH